MICLSYNITSTSEGVCMNGMNPLTDEELVGLFYSCRCTKVLEYQLNLTSGALQIDKPVY